MSNNRIIPVRGPGGTWAHQVKWLASLSDGKTVEGFVGVGDEKGTAWHKLQALLEKQKKLHVTQLRVQYAGLTIHGIPHAEAYTCKAIFATNSFRTTEYQEQVGLGSLVDGKLFIVRLAQDGQIWQEVKEGSEPSCVRGG